MAIVDSGIKLLGSALAFCAIVMTSTGPVFADVNVAAVQYQYIKELGEIVVSCGQIRAEVTDSTEAAIPDLVKKNIFPLCGKDLPRTFKKHQTVGKHQVDTKISMLAPTEHGFMGGLATAHLIMAVDGKKKVDCPLQQQIYFVRSVTLAVNDDLLFVDAEVDGKPSHITQVGLSEGKIVDDQALEKAAAK